MYVDKQGIDSGDVWFVRPLQRSEGKVIVHGANRGRYQVFLQYSLRVSEH